ncbi:MULTISPECIES: bifunctional 4-hydroxy-2-oxoglutarate aldolase/2-dehydro-3-deoxy-phosphogluconate aldolase [Sphingobium]|jgi:2-dehydro-3-deoxyphosphogluconate aldolase / (4S)-4-hydroxy-2-oxoglutarate aldolase|uniref:bifunctional 4-hydroxy-2-oxoglutarate aldolase/2-dehydro-3-deoxy-phosphogluconate aldolase n=1 Tax=Sphingobium TaxID=165695 RepID=UPI000C67E3F7|nr:MULTISPECIES: bifunctional 4-hydroxy-2-oxoglutarate aldolase/2-dehydro-3-deoxy-phosphogluconate aldolase [Sphingobium]MAP45843.1 2-dehydro-3-deoxyphosphogluconate aldolase [Sphingobium sp.]MEC9017179.1 bifunctional 4-hydroxy-2-oxoglutarate aldolase/2-dehydro-3-deoxy-phosphogluconate aldolase [Pseudomonadota bacterium]MAX15480.1 2-dehydro-3-deoxyphosphogluconate aldolase [Sphingobium sp.]MBS46779.1 2-dehydro-3-deoxyphosphogluconate aldolase [Sphingobium sp.]MCC4257485.1 bifunctional 4-hydrox|tara:strand:+ start:1378 stop:1998 length:621 start_codon:yes stop_codon:yes gene_type:complete
MSKLTVEQVMGLAPVIPVLVVERVEDALPIAQALVKGGLPALEVTLRTPAALDVIREMSQVEGAVVGAGTVLNAAQLDAAMEAGARFIVSPGLTEPLGKAAIAADVPFLPGTATAGDVMRGMDMGLSRFKFFPAETSGGLPALKALAAPLHAARFCPTGGITAQSAPEWLAQPFITCVGGSWVVPKGPVDAQKIEALAREAAALQR